MEHAGLCWARHSIHAKDMAKAAVERFPEPVEGAPGVFYTGYHSERSFGGAAWLITDKEAGNVLIDSPRFDRKLVSRIKVCPWATLSPSANASQRLARAVYSERCAHAHPPSLAPLMFSVALGRPLVASSTCSSPTRTTWPTTPCGPRSLAPSASSTSRRPTHSRAQSAALLSSVGITSFTSFRTTEAAGVCHMVLPEWPVIACSKCEVMLEGEGPWEVPGHEDLQIIHTPGHTYGHCVMYHEPSRALFTGDHMSFSRVAPGQLRFSKVCAQHRNPAFPCLIECAHPWCVKTMVAEVPTRLWRVCRTTTGTPYQSRSKSIKKLLQFDFLHVLPGHGRPGHLRDAAHREELVQNLLQEEGAL